MREFERTGEGVPLEEMLGWLEARAAGGGEHPPLPRPTKNRTGQQAMKRSAAAKKRCSRILEAVLETARDWRGLRLISEQRLKRYEMLAQRKRFE